jgi:hypothetical protein
MGASAGKAVSVEAEYATGQTKRVAGAAMLGPAGAP